MAVQFVFPGQQRVDANGSPLANYRLYFYEPGTTTPKDVYSDDELSTAVSQTNGIAADASGVWPRLYMSGKYKVVLKTAADVDVTTWDDFDPGLSTALGTSEALGVTAGGTGGTTAASARANLGAASQSSVTTNTSNITTLETLVDTGLHSDGDRFGTLATLDDITGASEFTSDGWKATNPFSAHLLHVRDEQTSGTDGGTFTTGDWRTRVLNTSKTNEITGASLASNQITLPAGTYWIDATAEADGVGGHKLLLRNVSDSANTLIGKNAFTASGGSAELSGRFTIAAEKIFELRHRCNVTNSDNGFGTALSYSVVEVYADVKIWKVA